MLTPAGNPPAAYIVTNSINGIERNRVVRDSRKCLKEEAKEKAMTSFLKRLWKEEDAPTAVEYGLMVALIAVVIIGVVTLLGQSVSAKFGEVEAAIGGAGT